MKKFLALVLALVMSLSLVACGSEESTDEGAADGDAAASELNVGVFYYNYSDAYITTVRNAMDALLEEAGITYNNYDGAGNPGHSAGPDQHRHLQRHQSAGCEHRGDLFSRRCPAGLRCRQERRHPHRILQPRG